MTGKITPFKNKSNNLISRYAGVDSPASAKARTRAWERRRHRLVADIERMIDSLAALSRRLGRDSDGSAAERDAHRQEIERMCADVAEIAEERRYLLACIENDHSAIEHYVWRVEGRYGDLFVDERIEHANEVARLARLADPDATDVVLDDRVP